MVDDPDGAVAGFGDSARLAAGLRLCGVSMVGMIRGKPASKIDHPVPARSRTGLCSAITRSCHSSVKVPLRHQHVPDPIFAEHNRIFEKPRFLLRGRWGAGTEMSLATLVWNLKRAMRVIGSRERPAERGVLVTLASPSVLTRTAGPGLRRQARDGADRWTTASASPSAGFRCRPCGTRPARRTRPPSSPSSTC